MLVLIVVHIFQGEECLAAHRQCSDRGVMPFAHWRVSLPPKRRRGTLPVQRCRGDPPLHPRGFFWQERECECIAARCQHSNGGAILPCMLEVSSTRVVGEECRAACCQCSNTEAIDCSLRFVDFFDFFSILKKFPILAICC